MTHEPTNTAPVCAARETCMSLLGLIADIRKAAGDPQGKLMQDELIARIGNLQSTAAGVPELVAERERLAALACVPGAWQCAKCSLRIVSSTLSAIDGGITSNNEPHACPNNCGPMWRVTERDERKDAYKTVETWAARATAAEARVAELEAAKERIAPVQGYTPGIPWPMHLEAYDAYRKKYGAQQALIEGGCRGGFGTSELDVFIPGWRERLSVLNAWKKRATAAESALGECYPLLGQARVVLARAKDDDSRTVVNRIDMLAAKVIKPDAIDAASGVGG